MENLTAIIPYWNGEETIERLLDSLPEELPIIIVDDHSDEPLQLEREGVTVFRPPAKGFFAGACNAGINACQTDVLLLNQDVWFEDSQWMDLIGKNREYYATIGEGVLGHPAWPNGYVQGTFMFIQREAWDRVGKFNTDMYPLWGATCEWQVRACRRDFKALPLPNIPGMGHRKLKRRRFGGAIEEALRRWPQHKGKFIRTPPEISVVMPCYNYGQYLDDAVNSLIGGETCLGDWQGQSIQSFEIIIVDDASTDQATRERVMDLHDPWKGIKSLLLSENLGTPGAINAGCAEAVGKYVHILSADDMREPWALEKQYKAATANKGMVVYGDIQSFKHGARLKILQLREYDFDKMLYKNPMPAGIMYPRKAWAEAGGYPTRMIYGREDWAFNIALGLKGYCGYKLQGLSGNLCRRERHNRSVRTSGKEWFQRFLSQLMSLYPNIYEGERPVGCCGGSSRRGVRRNVPEVKGQAVQGREVLPGRDGFKLIEYVGGNTAAVTFWGPVSGTRYKFGNNVVDKVKRIDAKDYSEMLKWMKGKRYIFSAYANPDPEPELGVDEKEKERVLGSGKVDATSSAKKLAQQEGIDLVALVGTGKDGRILKTDVMAVLANA